jgi:hypothetical protein
MVCSLFIGLSRRAMEQGQRMRLIYPVFPAATTGFFAAPLMLSV